MVESVCEERRDETGYTKHGLPNGLDKRLFFFEIPLNGDLKEVSLGLRHRPFENTDSDIRLTRKETWTKDRLEETKQNSDTKDWGHVERKGESKNKLGDSVI